MDIYMEDKIVLICATGRSGSTTLQRIINTIPNSNICGENYGAISSLLEFHYRLHVASQERIPGKYQPLTYEELIKTNCKPAWYNSYKMNEMEDCIRQTIIKMFKKDQFTNLWGFKEIRYDQDQIKLIKYFKLLFPQTKVIIQIRENIHAQSNSGWFKNDKDAVNYLYNMNKKLIHFYNQNQSWCYLTTFEKMFDENNIKNIFRFIDCSEFYNEDKLVEVLDNNIKD
jgi:hypothetical protein